MLEVPIDSLVSAINAINGGADELEVCSALNDGGLTPSFGLVTEVIREVNKLPKNVRPKINVMIRCRGGDDFIYSDLEMQTMLCDIKMFKETDVDGFVFGALTDTLKIDERNSMKVLDVASPKKVTFHRAFDLTSDYKEAVEILAKIGFSRVLTSGQRENVDDPVARRNITYLSKHYENSTELIIMPGGGVTISNVSTFIKMGCLSVHSSCKISVPRSVSMKRRMTFGHTDNNFFYVTDDALVREMKRTIQLAMEEKASVKCDSSEREDKIIQN